MKYIHFNDAFDLVKTVWKPEQIKEIGDKLTKQFTGQYRKELLVMILAPGYAAKLKCAG